MLKEMCHSDLKLAFNYQLLSDPQPLNFIVSRSVVLVISNLAINFFTSQLAHTNLLVRKSDSGLANQTQKAPGRPVIEDRISAGCHNTVWRKTYWTHRTSSGATLTPLPYLFQQTQG
jgi:hypothetical protein